MNLLLCGETDDMCLIKERLKWDMDGYTEKEIDELYVYANQNNLSLDFHTMLALLDSKRRMGTILNEKWHDIETKSNKFKINTDLLPDNHVCF